METLQAVLFVVANTSAFLAVACGAYLGGLFVGRRSRDAELHRADLAEEITGKLAVSCPACGAILVLKGLVPAGAPCRCRRSP